MSKKTAPSAEKHTETDDLVKLKPIIGIRPGIYLTVLYSIILIFIIFFLLVLPGLQNPGVMLLVETEPMGAAVRIDDTYMGVSGSYIYISKGNHTVEAVLPGFEPEKSNIEIPARIFGTLFFPLRKKIEFTLKTNDPAGAFIKAAYEYAEWSFGGEPTSSWQVPLVLSESAYRIGPYTEPEINEILEAASRFTVTRSALRDLTRAKILLDNGGLSPSPAGLLGSAADILCFLSRNPESAAWLSNLLPPETASIIKTSSWYQNEYTSETMIHTDNESNIQRQYIQNGIVFTQIPSGKITGGAGNKQLSPAVSAINSFMISADPVPRAAFESFLNENPQWKDGYTDYFEEEISALPLEIYEKEIITGISWYAAAAFCKWLTEQLPSSMADMEMRLPTEKELEYAAKTGVKNTEKSGWEWCADPFAPLQFTGLLPSFDIIEAVGSPERVLLGKPSSSANETRASLPPELSSPFVTFRIVIAEKTANR